MPPDAPEGTINLSDPDSRVMRTKGMPTRQAYNAQAAVNERHIILAAEITVDAADFGHLEPILNTTLEHLERHGVTEQPGAFVADAGYWHTRQIEQVTDHGLDLLVPPDGAMREGNRPGWEHGLYEVMRRKLSSEPSAVTSSTSCGRSRSNRSMGRSNTTGESTTSCEEADPPRTRSGG